MRIDVPTLSRGPHVVAAVFLASLLLTACLGETTTAPRAGSLEIVVHLDDLERWEASGPLVDSDTFCPSGRRHLIAAFNPDTDEEISVRKYLLMFDDLLSPADRPDALLLNEHVCEDGSGAFVAAENQERGDWEVRSGTGRYSALSGSGSTSFVVDLQANPSMVYVVAEVTFTR